MRPGPLPEAARPDAAYGGDGIFARGLFHPEGETEEPGGGELALTDLELVGEYARVDIPGAAGWGSRAPHRRAAASRPFRGRAVRERPGRGRARDVAWAATLRAAAPRQRRRERSATVLALAPGDLRVKERRRPPGQLLLLVVDLSGSMAGRWMALARELGLALLERTYVRRDRAAMVAFRDRDARLVFPPTNQAPLVRRALEGLPLGGTTPLAPGLELALSTLRRARSGSPELETGLVLISDGRANVGRHPGADEIRREVDLAASAVARERRLTTLFLDTTEEGRDDRAAHRLASRLDARRLLLWQALEAGRDPVREVLAALG